MKKIVYISGSRSDYSLIRRTLISLSKKTELIIIATCMHLSTQFGNTYRDIEADGFQVRKVDMLLDSDNLGSMAKSIGIGVYGITNVLEDIKPDLVFIEGDRGEALAGAIAAAHLNIPIVHHGCGDISGSIDNKIRYAISVLSDYLLAGNQESYQRLISYGLPAERITFVGEPGLDDILSGDYPTIEQINNKYDLPSKKPMILLIYHPNTEDNTDIDIEIKTILNSITELGIITVAIYSNSDAGGRQINMILDEKERELSFLKVFPHVERSDFLGLMNRCSLMVGNSSAGIVELPCFKKPFICIGSRQKNRLRVGNTLNVNCNKKDIIDSIHYAMHDKSFIEKLNCIKNPYGDGCASEKIVNHVIHIISSINEKNN